MGSDYQRSVDIIIVFTEPSLISFECDFLLQGYAAELDNTELSPLIPAALENKKDVLFGNLPEIYEFHNR